MNLGRQSACQVGNFAELAVESLAVGLMKLVSFLNSLALGLGIE